MIQIDPDDTDIKEAIQLVSIAKKTFEIADRLWDRSETSDYVYGQRFDAFWAAKEALQKAYANLGKLMYEAL